MKSFKEVKNLKGMFLIIFSYRFGRMLPLKYFTPFQWRGGASLLCHLTTSSITTASQMLL